eukprot:319538_1
MYEMEVSGNILKPYRFGKNSKKIIESRQKQLQEYLRTLLKSEHLCKTDLIMDFFSVPKAWLHIIEPKKEDISSHNRKQAKQVQDRRLREKEEEDMKIALALSASLAEVNLSKPKQKPNDETQYKTTQNY